MNIMISEIKFLLVIIFIPDIQNVILNIQKYIVTSKNVITDVHMLYYDY